MLSTKFEILNSKQIQRLKIQMTETIVLNFDHSDFGFVSDFDIQISNFMPHPVLLYEIINGWPALAACHFLT